MRLIVDARHLHYNRTGIGRYLRHLYLAMAGLGTETGLPPAIARLPQAITVLYSRRDAVRRLGAAFPRAAAAWTPAHHRLERWTLAAEAFRLRPALWHAPDHVCPQPLGWRTVITVHDLAFWRYPESHAPESRAYYAAVGRSVRQATRVICPSDATRRDLLAATGISPAKVRLVAEAPDPRYRLPGPVAPGARPYLVTVGTIEPRKNLAALFRALSVLPPAQRPELRVVGAPGWGAETITGLPSALGIAGDVRFLGRRPTAEIAAHYRGALALVYPSLLEGFGLPVLEAMAAGAPVIAAGRSSIPEVVDALAEAVRRVASDAALRDDLRRRGQARAGQFSWHRAARQTLEVFDEALHA
jgi:glycosyltransferase involved in cell wall biosynthesis